MNALMTDQWKVIPGWPYYEACVDGSIRSLDREVPMAYGATRVVKGKIRKPHVNRSNGYVYCTLYNDGKSKTIRVHRLILETFVGPCPEGYETRHINGDTTDNRLENLAWGTHSQNMKDRLEHGTDQKANQTHCVNGHEFTDENTHYRGNGTRYCRKCNNDRQNEKRNR